MDYSRALQQAIAVAKQAGALLRAEFHRAGGPRGTLSSAGSHGAKAGADDAAEDMIRAALATLPGNWDFVGEESGTHSGNDASGTGKEGDASSSPRHVWIVDPNDGTSHYLKAERASAVSIGLLRDGVPVLGAVYAFGYPDDRGDLVAWAEGLPLTRNGAPVNLPRLDSDAFADPWKPKDAAHAHRMIALVPRSVDHRKQPVSEFLGLPYVSLPSIAYRLAKLAAGDAALCVSFHGLSSWDVMAGHALLRAVGGTLVNHEGVEVTYTKDGKFGDPRMASAQAFFAGSPSAVRKLISDRRAGFESLMAFIKSKSHLERDEIFRVLPAVRGSLCCEDAEKLSRIQGGLVGLLAAKGGASEEAVKFARSLVFRKSYKPSEYPSTPSSDPLSRACILGLFGSLLLSSSELSPEFLAAQDIPSSVFGPEVSVASRAVAQAVRAAVETGDAEAVWEAAESVAEGQVAEVLKAAKSGSSFSTAAGSPILAQLHSVFVQLLVPSTTSSLGPALGLVGALKGLEYLPAQTLVSVQTRRSGDEGTWTCDVLELSEALGFCGRVWDNVPTD